MSENKIEDAEIVTIPEKTKKKKKEVPEHIKRKKKRRRRIKNIFFGIIWSYLISSILITNIDSFLIAKYSSIDFKIYIVLRLLILSFFFFSIWIIIGNKRFWKNIGLFFLFPIYPGFLITIKWTLWSIPKFLINNKLVILLYYFVENLIRFFLDFKYVLIRSILFIIGFVLLYNLDTYWLLIPILIFSFLQLNHLYIRFKQTFSPIKVFKMTIDDLEEVSQKPMSPEKIGEVISDSQTDEKKTDEEKIYKEMEYFLIINEFTKALNFKLKEIINSRVYMLSFLGKTLFSFLIAMIYFGAINYGIYLINEANFSVNSIPKFFDFFYYSFFSVIPDGTDITPVSTIAKSIRMAGVAVGIIINLLLLTVYLAISNERFKENLEKLLNFTDNYSKGINVYFEKKYGKNPTEGMKVIRAVGSGIDNTISMIKKLMNLK